VGLLPETDVQCDWFSGTWWEVLSISRSVASISFPTIDGHANSDQGM
jgi:hypothetical protein